jgi:phage baseplate assembly protein W
VTAPLAGAALPFRIVGGRVATAHAAEKAASDVRHLLSTRIGERVLRRGYGGGVHQYLTEHDDQAIRSLLRHDVELALATHLPQLRLVGPVRVVGAGLELRLRVDYTIDPADVVRAVEVPFALPGTVGGAP